jgi:hypothetical protein
MPTGTYCMFLILSYRIRTDTIFSANDNKMDVLLPTVIL